MPTSIHFSSICLFWMKYLKIPKRWANLHTTKNVLASTLVSKPLKSFFHSSQWRSAFTSSSSCRWPNLTYVTPRFWWRRFLYVEASALSLGGSDDFQCSNGHFFSHSLKNAAVFNHSNYKTESFTTSRVAQLDWPLQPLHLVPSSKSPGNSAKMSGKSHHFIQATGFVSFNPLYPWPAKTPRMANGPVLWRPSHFESSPTSVAFEPQQLEFGFPPLAWPFDSWGI